AAAVRDRGPAGRRPRRRPGRAPGAHRALVPPAPRGRGRDRVRRDRRTGRNANTPARRETCVMLIGPARDERRRPMATAAKTRSSVFDRIVCPVDGSSASLEAVRQAGLLRSDLTTIDLVGFAELDAEDSIYGVVQTPSKVDASVGRRLAEARALCPGASSELL